MKTKKDNKLRKMIKGELRKEQVASGAYDGRFSPKVFVDKKKKADKYACRNNKP